METFEDLRRSIGRIIGQSIGPGQFKMVISERQKMGAFTDSLDKIIIAILEYLEAQDNEKTVQSPK